MTKAIQTATGHMAFQLNMIKGRIAETLIRELFLAMGYNIFHYGMERSVPAITGLLNGVYSENAMQIRQMPDFIIQQSASKEVFFAEVKYRKNGKFDRKDLPDNYPWTNALFIIVSPGAVKAISFEELDGGEKITPKSKNFLNNRPEFKVHYKTLIDYTELATRIFKNL